MKRAGVAAAAALAFVVGSASAPVVAAPCDVFTDVQDTDNFCNSVQWLKNRSITLGCLTATTYCPTDVVTRASMALFLNRLGVALTPKLVGLQGNVSATTIGPTLFVPLCVVAGPAVVAYPQTARARGTFAGTANGPAVDVFLVVLINNTGGYQSMNNIFLNIPSPMGQQVLTWHSGNFAIPANATTQFALGIANPSLAGALNLGAGQCAIQVDLINANPTTPPFDQ